MAVRDRRLFVALGWGLAFLGIYVVLSGLASMAVDGCHEHRPSALFLPVVWLLMIPNAAWVSFLVWRYREHLKAFLKHPIANSICWTVFWFQRGLDEWTKSAHDPFRKTAAIFMMLITSVFFSVVYSEIRRAYRRWYAGRS